MIKAIDFFKGNFMQNSEIVYHNPTNLTQEDIKKVVIWLHGLGANGYDFVPIVPQLGLECAVKFIFPHAPEMPVTVNGGYVMPAWYDILEMGNISRKVDVAGVQASANRILQIIQAETARGVALKDIIIAGFSQGGAVAYHLAMSIKGLGGLLALSTYFATADTFENGIQADTNLPILICHGSFDETVSPQFAQLAINILAEKGFLTTYHSYPVAHQISFQEIGDIGQWIGKVLT